MLDYEVHAHSSVISSNLHDLKARRGSNATMPAVEDQMEDILQRFRETLRNIW